MPPALLAARAMPAMGTMGVHAARRSEDDNMIARNWFRGDNPECWGRSWKVERFRFGSEEARLKADRNRRHDHAGLM